MKKTSMSMEKRSSATVETPEQKLEAIRKTVEENAQRVAELGQWPSYIQPGSLLERIPQEGDKKASGFDAGIACSMDLIPKDKQELSAKLHANYSKEAVMQVRKEVAEHNPDSQAAWWLAACSICKEGEIDIQGFLQQIEDFKKLAADEQAREVAAEKTFEEMTHSFTLKDGIPFGDKDGCIQGAYIAGYSFGTQFAENYGIYFIGTYEGTLGLEDFKWSEEKDEKGRPKSGPVFGSKQFVKCVNEDELRRALEVVKAKLPVKEEKE